MGNVRRDEARSLARVAQALFKALCEYRQEYIGHFSIEEFVFLHSCRLTSQTDSRDEHRNTLRNAAIGSNVPKPLAGAEVAQRTT